jgi:hypothetical protein
MRETTKQIEIGDRKFIIGKFDALTGSYIIYTLLTQILPMGLGKSIEGLPENEGNTSLPTISKEQFSEIQKDCLKCCSEIQPVGGQVIPVPVMLKDGRWGVENLEQDALTVTLLTVQVLGFNVQSFFDGNALETLKQSFTQLNSSNAST